jgi:hypothetical protein
MRHGPSPLVRTKANVDDAADRPHVYILRISGALRLMYRPRAFVSNARRML